IEISEAIGAPSLPPSTAELSPREHTEDTILHRISGPLKRPSAPTRRVSSSTGSRPSRVPYERAAGGLKKTAERLRGSEGRCGEPKGEGVGKGLLGGGPGGAAPGQASMRQGGSPSRAGREGAKESRGPERAGGR